MTPRTSQSANFGWQSRKILSISLIKRKSCLSAESQRLENFIWIIAWVLLAKSGHMRWPTFPSFPTWIFTFELVFENEIFFDSSTRMTFITQPADDRSKRVSRLCVVIHRKWKRLHLIYADDISRHLHAKMHGIPFFSMLQASNLICRLGKRRKTIKRWEFCNEHRTKRLDWWHKFPDLRHSRRCVDGIKITIMMEFRRRRWVFGHWSLFEWEAIGMLAMEWRMHNCSGFMQAVVQF